MGSNRRGDAAALKREYIFAWVLLGYLASLAYRLHSCAVLVAKLQTRFIIQWISATATEQKKEIYLMIGRHGRTSVCLVAL